MAAPLEHESRCPEHEESKEWWEAINLTQHQGFWMVGSSVPGHVAFGQHFEARKEDLLLITAPKSGTTWLKALAFATVNRTRYDLHNHPLLTTNPHDLVPFLELQCYANGQIPDLTSLPSPRLFATHTPYQILPRSVIESGCKIVYLCRNPKDVLVSMWKFIHELLPENTPSVSIEEAFESFCRGISLRGPFWEHVLGYWKASLETPERVLFMKFEELKKDPIFHLRRLAEFLGFPFSVEEERQGVIEEIQKLCSFENLSSLDVNKRGKTIIAIEGKAFFRRGAVGDWENHLTTEMKDKLDNLMQEKLQGTGLIFKDR